MSVLVTLVLEAFYDKLVMPIVNMSTKYYQVCVGRLGDEASFPNSKVERNYSEGM